MLIVTPAPAGVTTVAGAAAVTTGANASILAPGKVDTGSIGTDFAQAQIVTTAAVGLWAIHSYLQCSVAGAGSGTMTTTWGWTDDVGAQTDVTQTHALTAATVPNSLSRVIKVASGHITIKCLITGAYLLGAQYTLTARAQYLG